MARAEHAGEEVQGFWQLIGEQPLSFVALAVDVHHRQVTGDRADTQCDDDAVADEYRHEKQHHAHRQADDDESRQRQIRICLCQPLLHAVKKREFRKFSRKAGRILLL